MAEQTAAPLGAARKWSSAQVAAGSAHCLHKELQELGLLYRQVASDLAALREDPNEVEMARSINQLLARAHNLLYAGRGHFRLGNSGVLHQNISAHISRNISLHSGRRRFVSDGGTDGRAALVPRCDI